MYSERRIRPCDRNAQYILLLNGQLMTQLSAHAVPVQDPPRRAEPGRGRTETPPGPFYFHILFLKHKQIREIVLYILT